MKKSFIPWLLAGVFAVTLSRAEAETYSWRDASGNTFYGSKPPAGAKSIQKLNAPNISRYSSSKLLAPYRARLGARDGSARVETSTATASAKNSSAKNSSDRETGGEARKIVEEKLPIPPDTALTVAQVQIENNDQFEVTSCRVVVKNTATIPTGKVLVSFEFPDGTLVPADGVEVINPGGEATYQIASELLPVSVRPPDTGASTPGALTDQLRPRAIVQENGKEIG